MSFTLPIPIDSLTTILDNKEIINVNFEESKTTVKKSITYLTNLMIPFTIDGATSISKRYEILSEFIECKYRTESEQLLASLADIVMMHKTGIYGTYQSILGESETGAFIQANSAQLEGIREYLESIPAAMIELIPEFKPLYEGINKKSDDSIGANICSLMKIEGFIELYNSHPPKYDTIFTHSNKSGKNVMEFVMERGANHSFGFLDAIAKGQFSQ